MSYSSAEASELPASTTILDPFHPRSCPLALGRPVTEVAISAGVNSGMPFPTKFDCSAEYKHFAIHLLPKGLSCSFCNSWDYAVLVPQFAFWNNRSISFGLNASAFTFRSYWEIENGTIFVHNQLIASKPLGLNQFSFSLYAGAFSFG